jgi:hypothetical protein
MARGSTMQSRCESCINSSLDWFDRTAKYVEPFLVLFAVTLVLLDVYVFFQYVVPEVSPQPCTVGWWSRGPLKGARVARAGGLAPPAHCCPTPPLYAMVSSAVTNDAPLRKVGLPRAADH